MTVHAVQCRSCGGAVAHEAGAPVPRCVFCGRDALEETDLAAQQPAAYLPFSVQEPAARLAFRGWARSRFWAPRSMRRATVTLRPLHVPAWSWEGDLETHWAALIPAATRSGKRPVTGQESARIDGVMVPSSPALAAAELDAISPFALSGRISIEQSGPPGPFEVSTLSRAVAQERGVARLRAVHGEQIAARIGASTLNTSCLAQRVHGEPLLLPVWIGAYLHGDTSYRVVINGQTQAITGSAPISWLKVTAAVLAGLLLLLLILAVVASQ